MKRFFDFINDSKWLVIIFCLVLSLILSYGLTKLEIRSVLEGELPENNEIILTNNQFKQIFGNVSYVVFALINEDGLLNEQTLFKIWDISDNLRTFPGIKKEEILSLATFTQVEEIDDEIVIESLLSDIPQTEETMADLKQQIIENPIIWQRLVSADLTTTLISAPVAKTTSQVEVYQAAMDITQRFSGPEEIISYSFQIVDQAIDKGIDQDVSVLFPLAIVLIGVLFFLCFANLRSVFLPLLTMIMAVVSTMGVMGWFGFKISTVTSIIPVLIISLGSSYGIHLLERYFSASNQQEAKQSLSLVARPIILAGFTSAIGFFTLVVFKIISLREFGVFAGLGIVFMTFYVLVFCPAMLFVLPVKKNNKKGLEFFTRLVDYLLAKIWLIANRPRLIVFGTIIIMAVSFLGISRLKVGSNPIKFFPQGHSVRQASELFADKFDGTGVIEVMIETTDNNRVIDPVVMQQIWDFQKYCEGLESVGYTNSIIDSLRYINKTLSGSETIPSTSSLAEQYLVLYSMNPLVNLESYLDNSRHRLKLTIWMNIDDSLVIENSYRQMQEYISDNFSSHVSAKFGGENMEWIAQNHYIVTGKILNIIVSIIIILVICSFYFRSWKIGLTAIWPLSFSTITIFGLMGFLGIRLDLASCILTGVSVGVGVDFSIHYISRLLENKTITPEVLEKVNQQAGRPILYDSISNIIGFSVLLFSAFTPIRDFGALIVLSMITCSLGTLLFIPVIIPKQTKD